jgi:hypothetical protein
MSIIQADRDTTVLGMSVHHLGNGQSRNLMIYLADNPVFRAGHAGSIPLARSTISLPLLERGQRRQSTFAPESVRALIEQFSELLCDGLPR